jgi:hypothetical protein
MPFHRRRLSGERRRLSLRGALGERTPSHLIKVIDHFGFVPQYQHNPHNAAKRGLLGPKSERESEQGCYHWLDDRVNGLGPLGLRIFRDRQPVAY